MFTIPVYCIYSLSARIGEGRFGEVWKATLMAPKGPMEVALKVLKTDESDQESQQVKLLIEAAIMGQFKHPNIVRLYGMVTVTQPVS